MVDGNCFAGARDKRGGSAGDLDRRKPGTSRYTTQRREADEVKILRGVRGQDHGYLPSGSDREHRSALQGLPEIRTCSAGPRRLHLSPEVRPARHTVAAAAPPPVRPRCGSRRAIAKKYPKQVHGIEIVGFLSQLGPIKAEGSTRPDRAEPFFPPMRASWRRWMNTCVPLKKEGNSVGGQGVRGGAQRAGRPGELVFDRLTPTLPTP